MKRKDSFILGAGIGFYCSTIFLLVLTAILTKEPLSICLAICSAFSFLCIAKWIISFVSSVSKSGKYAEEETIAM